MEKQRAANISLKQQLQQCQRNQNNQDNSNSSLAQQLTSLKQQTNIQLQVASVFYRLLKEEVSAADRELARSKLHLQQAERQKNSEGVSAPTLAEPNILIGLLSEPSQSAEASSVESKRSRRRMPEEETATNEEMFDLQQQMSNLQQREMQLSQQNYFLQQELAELERARKREGVNLQYLKNIVVKLLETNDVEALLPVVTEVLQLSADEAQRVRNAQSRSVVGTVVGGVGNLFWGGR